MTVSSVNFQSVINRMHKISTMQVSNRTAVNRSAAVGQSASIEKSASIGKVGKTTSAENKNKSALRTNHNNSLSLSAAQKTGAGFRKIAEKLQSTDWSREYRFSKKKELQNGVRAFAEEYNRFFSEIKKVADGEGSSYGSKFISLVQDNRDVLAGIGLTVEGDGTLSVDSRALKKAKAEAFAAVFKGTDSVAGKAAVNSIYAEAQSAVSAVGKLYGYGAGLGGYGLGTYGAGTYGLGNLGAYALGSLGTYGLESMALGNSIGNPLASYGLGGYGYGAYGYGASGLNSLYAALSSYAGRYIDTQV